MAQELTISFSAFYEDAVEITGSVEIAELLITLATAKIVHTKQSVGTSEEAVELGDISSRGFCVLVNKDTSNYIEVKTGTGGTVYAKMFPKGSTSGINFCVVHLGSGAQSPFVTANTASCEMEIFLCPL